MELYLQINLILLLIAFYSVIKQKEGRLKTGSVLMNSIVPLLVKTKEGLLMRTDKVVLLGSEYKDEKELKVKLRDGVLLSQGFNEGDLEIAVTLLELEDNSGLHLSAVVELDEIKRVKDNLSCTITDRIADLILITDKGFNIEYIGGEAYGSRPESRDLDVTLEYLGSNLREHLTIGDLEKLKTVENLKNETIVLGLKNNKLEHKYYELKFSNDSTHWGIIGRDITKTVQEEKKLIEQLGLMQALAQTVSMLSQNEDLEKTVPDALRIIGSNLKYPKFYVYEFLGPSKVQCTFLWDKEAGLSQPKSDPIEVHPLQEQFLKDGVNLKKARAVHISEFDPRVLLEEDVTNAQYIIVCPIYVKDVEWGGMVFFTASNDLLKIQYEIQTLDLISTAFGSVLALRESLIRAKKMVDFSYATLEIMAGSFKELGGL